MKNFLIVLVAVLLVSGCGNLSRVTLRTQPPGGSIIVEGMPGKVVDGNTIELAKGQYNLISEKEGFAGTSQDLLVDGKKNLVVTVPLGTGFSRIEISTIPGGKQIHVKETGQVVQDGEIIYLSPGAYTFLLREAGYKDSEVRQEIDGLAEFRITVPRGEGYAHLAITGRPEGTTVRFDNGKPMPLPVTHELTAGEHEITVEHEGYFPETETVTIQPGSKADISYNLKKIPTSGQVVVTTTPDGGTIFFNDKAVGTGAVNLGQLPFGSHSVSGELGLNKLTRLTGQKSFSLKIPEAGTLLLPLDRKEYLFEGQWLPIKEAREKEEKRYRKQRVANTVAVTVGLDEENRNALKKMNNLAESLHQILRVGDRVNFVIDGEELTVWKRHSLMTPEFELEVAAVQGKGESISEWVDDAAEKPAVLKPGDTVLADIAFGLHGQRTDAPLLDLRADQLGEKEEKVYRNVADGVLTLVAEGGENFSINGAAANNNNGLHFELIEPGSEPVALTWKTPPARIFLISDQANPLKRLETANLLMQEKKMVRLADRMEIKEVTRLSSGPDYTGWQRKILEASGPLADQIDLTIDEIGPHEQPGEYHRVWIVRYQDRSGLSQRQLAVQYSVGTDLKDGSSDIFLRRLQEEQ